MKRRQRSKGTAIVETAFMIPWIFFLFVGVLDFGFYSYAAISIQNAARVAAIRAANSQFSGDIGIACGAAWGELRGLPNVPSTMQCAANPGAMTDAIPLAVRLRTLNNSTTPPCADCGVNAAATSIQVEVTYRTLPMVPIPGILMGRLTMSRVAEARVLVR